jgi:hypothetical protein
MDDVRIASGGRLLTTRLLDSGEGEERKEILVDLTDHAPGYLFCNCTIDSDVILKDIFLLLNRHLEAFTEIFNDNLPPIVKEGFSPYVGTKSLLTSLMLMWEIRYDEAEEKVLSGNTVPHCYGTGSSDEDIFGIEFAPANEIAELPVRLSSKLRIWKEEQGEYEVFENPEYTLGQILYSIILELAFFGSPANRDKKHEEMLNSIKKVKKEIG